MPLYSGESSTSWRGENIWAAALQGVRRLLRTLCRKQQQTCACAAGIKFVPRMRRKRARNLVVEQSYLSVLVLSRMQRLRPASHAPGLLSLIFLSDSAQSHTLLFLLVSIPSEQLVVWGDHHRRLPGEAVPGTTTPHPHNRLASADPQPVSKLFPPYVHDVRLHQPTYSRSIFSPYRQRRSSASPRVPNQRLYIFSCFPAPCPKERIHSRQSAACT